MTWNIIEQDENGLSWEHTVVFDKKQQQLYGHDNLRKYINNQMEWNLFMGALISAHGTNTNHQFKNLTIVPTVDLKQVSKV